MIYKAVKQDIENYFNQDYISQSMLKMFKKGFDYYQQNIGRDKKDKYFDEPKDHFIIGSAVDMLVTGTEEDFSATYYLTTIEEKPSATEISIIRYVYDRICEHNLNIIVGEEIIMPIEFGNLTDHDAILEQAFNFHNYQPKWGFPAKKAKFDTEICSKYWKELLLAGSKQIITAEDLRLINALANTIKTSDNTSFLFHETTRYDVIFQVPIYSSHQNISYKGLVDAMLVNHGTKQITLYDFKTMSDSSMNFPYDYKRRDYDLQAAFYCFIISNPNFILDITARYPKNIRNYTVIGFDFIVVSKDFPNTKPAIFSTSLDNLKNVIDGKPRTLSTSVDADGNLYVYQYPAIPSVHQLGSELKYALQYNSDPRLINPIPLY